jgi:hypothetical protein
MKTEVTLKRLWPRGILRAILTVTSMTCLFGCNHIPNGVSMAPKIIEVDGREYIACEGFVNIYQPSRDIADSSSKTYEITFTDDYGKTRDLKDIAIYAVREPQASEPLNYAMPTSANPSNTTATYVNGEQIRPGSVVVFGKDGDEGIAQWLGPGKWKPVPCAFTGR